MDRPPLSPPTDPSAASRIDERGRPAPTLEQAAFTDLPALPAPRRLVEDAADILRDRILAGVLVKGTHLVEAKIAAQLNVSRGTVREAFSILAAEGLIVEGSRRGAFVVSLTEADVREIYDVRAAVEGRAAQLIVRRGRPSDLAELEGIVGAMEIAARAGDRATVRRQDLEFHERVCLLSGNRRLHEVFLRHVPAVQTLIRHDDRLLAGEATTAQHRPLLDALRSGDPEAAGRAFQQHCDEARDLVAPYFDRTEDATGR